MDIIRNFPLFTIVLSLFSGVLCTMLKGKEAKIYTLIYEGILIVLTACVRPGEMRSAPASSKR